MNYDPQPRRCQHCGHNRGLETVHMHVGGQGLVERVICVDTSACTERWDDAHGLPTYSDRARRYGDTMSQAERDRRNGRVVRQVA